MLKNAAVACAACGAFVLPALHADVTPASLWNSATPVVTTQSFDHGEPSHDQLQDPTRPPAPALYSDTRSTFGLADPLSLHYIGGSVRTM